MAFFRIVERIPKQNQLEAINALRQFLVEASKDLNVKFEVKEVDRHGYPLISVDGEDAEVFKEFLDKAVGVAPESLEELAAKTAGRAIVVHVEGPPYLVVLDVGLAHLGYLAYLSQKDVTPFLAHGKHVSFEDSPSSLCMKNGLPLNVSLLAISREEKKIWVTLSKAQIDAYNRWIRMFLDRVIVINSTRRKLKNALAETQNMRFIASVDRLGLFCQCIVCKLGVDADRIQKTLSRQIPEASFCLVSPRRFLQL